MKTTTKSNFNYDTSDQINNRNREFNNMINEKKYHKIINLSFK